MALVYPATGGGGTGGGTVKSVTAADTSVVVGGTATDPTVRTATLDVIAADHAPAADWSNNSKKITGLAAASAATDAASLANTLDQFGAPGANVAFNAKKITGLANGSAATDAQAYGQGVASLLTAAGDTVYASAANTLARLAKGSDGQVLTLASGVPSWAAAAAGGSTDGWTSDAHTWTYASATSFTVAGVDLTAQFQVGTFLRLTQTTVKYFIVTASSFSTDTTVTITGGTDYTLANAAITSPFYSYQLSPQGWPAWFTYAGAATGFSALATAVYKFQVQARQCMVYMGISGTSNATTFTVTAPIASASWIDTNLGVQYPCKVTDNGVQTSGLVLTVNSSTTIQLFKTISGGAFTNSGTKASVGVLFLYPI